MIYVEYYFRVPYLYRVDLAANYFLKMKVLPSFLRVQIQKHTYHTFLKMLE